MPYKLMYGLSVTVAVAIGVIGAIQVADPVKLGLSVQAVEWLKIITVGLGILAGVLPSIRTPPNDARTGLD